MVENPLHLYVHFPFCSRRAPVDHRIIYLKEKEEILSYCNALRREMRMAAPDFAQSEVQSVMIGGGHPLISGPDPLFELIKTNPVFFF